MAFADLPTFYAVYYILYSLKKNLLVIYDTSSIREPPKVSKMC
jgi:hypothetical protein